MIRLEKLNKYFNRGKQNEIHVINNVSLELPDRGLIAIFGKSGCGKTTLLNVIGGLDNYSSGSVTIEGESFKKGKDALRNRMVGYIFQNYNLNPDESCFENVADALRLCGMTDAEEIERRVLAALANVDMEKFKNRTPDTLSGGQQQRIAIARAIVKNPPIILADEPTGNLDEANTLLIMDLLKQISRDHLVLLVTHEANLVDYYCDRVIELSDGQIVDVRENESANGLTAKDKNVIYLGELEKSALSSENAEIEYYGDVPSEPIKLRIIHHAGKLYLQVNTPKVQLLEANSEVKLREGTFEPSHTAGNEISQKIDMSALPAIEGKHYGKLFSFWGSVKSGYLANFSKKRRGKKLLRVCMALFAAVLVMMSATTGTSIRDMQDILSSYNHNVFYVYTDCSETSKILSRGLSDPQSGMDFIRLNHSFVHQDETFTCSTGFFETFSPGYFSMPFMFNAVRLPIELAKDYPLIVGKNQDLSENEVLMTTAVADTLLKKSTLNFIRDYDDLLGLQISFNSDLLYIAGIVRSEETAVYLDPFTLLREDSLYVDTHIFPASLRGLSVSTGEAVFYSNDVTVPNEPLAGDTVKWIGVPLKVTAVKHAVTDYYTWLADKGITIPNYYDWITEKDEDGNITLAQDARIFDYFDLLFAHFGEFFIDYAKDNPNDPYAWLYSTYGSEEAYYLGILLHCSTYSSGYADIDRYYSAKQWKLKNGSYPSPDELTADDYKYFYQKCDELLQQHEKERFYVYETNPINWCYFVSDEQYIELSALYVPQNPDAHGEQISEYSYKNYCFTVIHSTDPAKTTAWLKANLPEIDTGDEYTPAVQSPEDLYNERMEDSRVGIISDMITIVVVIALLSVCMYFIMRSTLMSRVKEVGIYRAIGVSRKNLVFRFFVESLVLTTLTVFLGFAFSSALLFLWSSSTPLMLQIFYYPWWMAGILFVLLYAICIFCGILPIRMLLQKTPSQILAKYDI